MQDSHSCDPGSIPGQCTVFFVFFSPLPFFSLSSPLQLVFDSGVEVSVLLFLSSLLFVMCDVRPAEGGSNDRSNGGVKTFFLRFSPLGGDKHVGGHNFKTYSFPTARWCDVCGRFLWGLVRQGMKCKSKLEGGVVRRREKGEGGGRREEGRGGVRSG